MAPKKATQETLNINGLEVAVRGTGDENDYISLTDLAKEKGPESSAIIGNWMRNKDTIALLGIWEKLNNTNFNSLEFEGIEKEAGRNAFTMSPKRWITLTNAIGIKAKGGRYGGAFAHVDIALDFATWISPEFRLYVFQEYKRLKKDESSRLNTDWNEKRIFAALNYRIHTDAVKETLLPNISRTMAGITYAREAELLNLAMFGITSKDWRIANPNKDGNMRDFASVSQNLILSNLESMNAQLIRQGMDMQRRYQVLWQMARDQEKTFEHHPTVQKMETEQRRYIEGIEK